MSGRDASNSSICGGVGQICLGHVIAIRRWLIGTLPPRGSVKRRTKLVVQYCAVPTVRTPVSKSLSYSTVGTYSIG